jgi:hypothetical protein
MTMNERIKELAEQNGFIHKWMPPGEQYEKLQSLEKFAELIIRECAQRASEVDVYTRQEMTVAEYIKISFGVE